MKSVRSRNMWCVEFWDFGAWNEWGNTRHKNKNWCIAKAQELNKDVNPQHPENGFEGHRFRVRRVVNWEE